MSAPRRSPDARGDAPGARAARTVLVVGGRADVQLAWCRLLGASARVSLLRWDAALSAADASRHCASSVWLCQVDAGVASWHARLGARLRDGHATMLVPADPLAHALLCDGSVTLPEGVEVLGPSPGAYALGADRLRAFQIARATGWHVPDWEHVARPGPPPPFVLPCVVRPRRDVTIVDDEPARFSTKRVIDMEALDAKLRDDVPRGEVLIQAVPKLPTLRVCAAARDGELVCFWPLRTASASRIDLSSLRESTRRLVGALGWTGLLQLECAVGPDGPTLHDLQCGGGDAIVDATRAGAPLVTSLVAGSTGAEEAALPSPSRLALLDPAPVLGAALGALRHVAAKLSLRLRAALWPWTGGGARAPRLSRSLSILVVCKGNINRSVVAEHLLRTAGYGKIASAALLGLAGRRPSFAAERFLADTIGVPPGAVHSQSLRRAVERSGPFDVALCFERRQAVELSDRCPELRGRIHLVTALAPAHLGPVDIADPHGRSESDHRRCFVRIQQLLQSAVAHADAPPAAPAPQAPR